MQCRFMPVRFEFRILTTFEEQCRFQNKVRFMKIVHNRFRASRQPPCLSKPKQLNYFALCTSLLSAMVGTSVVCWVEMQYVDLLRLHVFRTQIRLKININIIFTLYETSNMLCFNRGIMAGYLNLFKMLLGCFTIWNCREA